MWKILTLQVQAQMIMYEKIRFLDERVVTMDERKANVLEMTNEEYRRELANIFENIHENYILRWFYRFITEKLRSS